MFLWHFKQLAKHIVCSSIINIVGSLVTFDKLQFHSVGESLEYSLQFTLVYCRIPLRTWLFDNEICWNQILNHS